MAVVAAVGGVVVLATGCVGYLVRPLSWACGSVLVLAAVLALFCAGGPTRALGAVGLAAGLLLVLWEWAIARPSRRACVQPGPERPATREIR